MESSIVTQQTVTEYPTQTPLKQGSHAADTPLVLPQNFTEVVFDLLSSQDDDNLLWVDASGNLTDVRGDGHLFPTSGNDFLRELDWSDEFIAAEKTRASANSNPFLLLNDVRYPPEPCNHCLQYGSQCLVTWATSPNPDLLYSCSTCVALSYECSLGQGKICQRSESHTTNPFVSRFHTPNKERDQKESNTQLSSKSIHRGVTDYCQHVGPPYDRSKHSSSRETQRTRLLKAWFLSHQEHPYPSPRDTFILSNQSGLTEIQVTNWFTNARRRQKMPGPKSKLANCGSSIPNLMPHMLSSQKQGHSLLQDENSPSDAIRTTPASANHSFHASCSSLSCKHNNPNSNAPANSDVVLKSSNLVSSTSSSPSMHHSSTGKQRPPTLHSRKPTKLPTKVTYQCTFCLLPFQKKSDWVRHERSVHMPCLDTYTCTMLHESNHYHSLQIWRTKSDVPECALCGQPAPDEAHRKSHGFETCSERPIGQRTFSRKDHFWQHLCKYHNCRKWEGWGLNLDLWRKRNNDVGGRCGFCGIWLNTWDERMIHVEHHFKMGMHIDDWVSHSGVEKLINNIN